MLWGKTKKPTTCGIWDSIRRWTPHSLWHPPALPQNANLSHSELLSPRRPAGTFHGNVISLLPSVRPLVAGSGKRFNERERRAALTRDRPWRVGMPSPPKRRRSSQRYTSAEFKPYVTALGQLALARNDLQESLAAIFWTLMNPRPQAGDSVDYTPLRVWASVKSDRTQREMLKAVILNSNKYWGRDRMRVELRWLIDRAAELENSRNDAVHSPLFVVDKSLYGLSFTGKKVAPAYWLFNPRAANLAKREDLLNEFRYCRDEAIILADYAQSIDRALINPKSAWPDRPLLPNRQKKAARSVPKDANKQN